MKAILAALTLFMANEAVVLSAEDEARAQALMREIRCVACENEPISHSASSMAVDMRDRVRTLIAEGASDEDVRDWFEARYGEFVLFRPKAENPTDWVLWLGPFALLVLGAGLGYGVLKRRAGETVRAVPPEDVQD